MSKTSDLLVRMRDAIRAMKQKIDARIAMRKAKTDPEQVEHKSDMEMITDTIITEMIGCSSGALWKHYNKLIKNFSIDSNPLGVEDAKNILFSLLLLAVAQRRLLPLRVAQSIESGTIFEKYFGKMVAINKLAVISHNALIQMKSAQSKFEYQRDLLDRITDSTYIQKYIKSEGERQNGDMTSSDILETVLGGGGEIDREQDQEQS